MKKLTSSPTSIMVLVLFVVLVVLLTRQTTAVQANTPIHAYQNEQIIIKLAPTAAIEQINTIYNTTILRVLPTNTPIYLLQTPANSDTITLLQALNSDPQVDYAELNFVGFTPEANLDDIAAWGIDTAALPSDLYSWPSDLYSWPSDLYSWPSDLYSWLDVDKTFTTTTTTLRTAYDWELSGADDAHYNYQPPVYDTNLRPRVEGVNGRNITIAILDTGVDLTHPLLAAVLVPGYDFVDDDAIPYDKLSNQDNDGDGLFNEVAGHGTHIAGIIHLVAPEANIMPIRVLDSDGQGDSFYVAEAMLYAVDHGATVINLSLGAVVPSQILLDTLEQVAAQGVVVVAAAGNMNDNIPLYPAAAPCALAVGAATANHKADYASYGEWIDVMAPGGRVFSSYLNGSFGWWQGTSMSTPFVTGQAALLRGLNPNLTIEEVGLLIAGTADSLDAQNSNYAGLLGAGMIDIGASLEQLATGTWPNSPSPLQNCIP